MATPRSDSAFGAIAAAGYYLNVMGRIDDAATILVITIAYTVTFWARRQPDRLEARLGPFGRIGRAISESQQDITQWVNERTLLAGVLIALGYGVAVAVVIGKHVVAAVLSTLYSPGWRWRRGSPSARLSSHQSCGVVGAAVSPQPTDSQGPLP